LADPEGGILPGRAAEIAEDISAQANKKAKDSGAKKEKVVSAMDELKAEWEKMADEEPPASKKAKSVHTLRVQAYGEFHKMTSDQLKDILGYK
jgi:DUF4097 and DUF4098 domain-containing protein YvlB